MAQKFPLGFFFLYLGACSPMRLYFCRINLKKRWLNVSPTDAEAWGFPSAFTSLKTPKVWNANIRWHYKVFTRRRKLVLDGNLAGWKFRVQTKRKLISCNSTYCHHLCSVMFLDWFCYVWVNGGSIPWHLYFYSPLHLFILVISSQRSYFKICPLSFVHTDFSHLILHKRYHPKCFF